MLEIDSLCDITTFMADTRQILQRYVRISKYLSKHLRHQPERLELELLPGGWIEVDKFLAAASAHGFEISLADLQQVVATNDKQRFAFNESGDLIRANQGHSITSGRLRQRDRLTAFSSNSSRHALSWHSYQSDNRNFCSGIAENVSSPRPSHHRFEYGIQGGW
jgi:RNA 2'-phosphotransferase, Tpt1 / KptA family